MVPLLKDTLAKGHLFNMKLGASEVLLRHNSQVGFEALLDSLQK